MLGTRLSVQTSVVSSLLPSLEQDLRPQAVLLSVRYLAYTRPSAPSWTVGNAVPGLGQELQVLTSCLLSCLWGQVQLRVKNINQYKKGRPIIFRKPPIACDTHNRYLSAFLRWCIKIFLSSKGIVLFFLMLLHLIYSSLSVNTFQHRWTVAEVFI